MTGAGRSDLLLGSLAALVPILSASSAIFAQTPPRAESAVDPLPIPQGSMILTRAVHKSLAGGQEIVSSRSYEVRFSRDGDGVRVDGALVAVDVKVPDGLEALAAIERARADSGMFPIYLERSGRIAGTRTSSGRAATAEAAALVTERLNSSSLGAADRSAAGAFIGQVARQGGDSVWPEDLFRPRPGHHEALRRLPLEDGTAGEIATQTDARAAPDGGLLETFERTVVTRIGASSRKTRETWTLRPIATVSVR